MTVSIWQDTAAWPEDLPHQHVTADVCVVGAGITGALIATWLGEAGKDVVVVEAGVVAGGATSRNAGACVPGFRTDYHLLVEQLGHEPALALRRELLASRETLRSYCERFDVPHERNGSQFLGISAEEAAGLRQAARALARDGDEVEYTEADPFGRGFIGRLFQPGDFVLQPYLLASRMMASSGALVIENSEVRELVQQGDTITVRSRLATIECRHVVLATNAWSRILHPYFRDKVFPTRGQVFATEPALLPRIVDVHTETDNRYGYFRQLPDGRFLIGGYRNRFVDEEVGFADETTPHLQLGLEHWFVERFPEVANLRITHRWAGIMGFSPDGLPLIGRLPDMPNVYFAVGFSGAGLSFGPMAVRRCVDYLLNDTHPGLLHVDRPGLTPPAGSSATRFH